MKYYQPSCRNCPLTLVKKINNPTFYLSLSPRITLSSLILKFRPGFLSLKKVEPTILSSLNAHQTPTLRSCKRPSWRTRVFLEQKYLLFWLFSFELSVNYTSSNKTTSFYILFFALQGTCLSKFFHYSVFSWTALPTLFTQLSATFIPRTYALHKSTVNGQLLFKRPNFTHSITIFYLTLNTRRPISGRLTFQRWEDKGHVGRVP
jgi:hypothetical protein